MSWMQYFSQTELDVAIDESKKPSKKLSKEEAKKQEAAEQADESDSEPSCDNYDEYELAARFDAAISEDEKAERPREEPPSSPPQIAETRPSEKKEDQIRNIQDDLDQMKKKNKKLSERFDTLRAQINAKILNDHYQKKVEVANSYYFQQQHPTQQSPLELAKPNDKNDRAFTMIQRTFASQSSNHKDGVLQKIQFQAKDSSAQFRNLGHHSVVQPITSP